MEQGDQEIRRWFESLAVRFAWSDHVSFASELSKIIS
jgi:hypothetical protein